jgi:hypothetical protein
MAALGLWLFAPDKPRVALEALYPGDYRAIGGVRLRLRDTTGPREAPAVILLHGFSPTPTISMFRPQRRLAGAASFTLAHKI